VATLQDALQYREARVSQLQENLAEEVALRENLLAEFRVYRASIGIRHVERIKQLVRRWLGRTPPQ